MSHSLPPDPPSEAPAATPAGRVLHMTARDRERAARIVEGLRAHWFSLRAGRAVPDRVDVGAAGLGPALDHAFILERIAPGAARLRLAGRHLIDLMGMEVRGMPFCALFNPSSRGRVSDVLESVFRGPQLADLALAAPGIAGGPDCPGRMLLMPLKSDLGDVTRALGCLVATCGPGRAPRRFDLAAEDFEPVLPGAAVLAPGGAPLPESCVPRVAEPTGLRMLPRPAPEDETGPRRRRFRSFGTEGEAGPAGRPGEGKAPWQPRLVIDNS